MEDSDFASQLFAPNMIPIESVIPPRPTPFVLLRQNSLSIEQVYKNGISKKVHVVVKNHPFLIQVGLVSNVWEGQKLDLNRYSVEARLVYDNDCLKEVGFVKLKPIEFKAHISDRGDQATVEIRPKVLTSQLEDMLFRVMILALDQTTKKPVNGLAIVSEPIKVVSKPEQVKKKKEPVKEKKPVKEKAPEKVKKTMEQIVSEGLSRIESNVLNHDKLLGLLAATEAKPKEAEPVVAPVTLPSKKIEIVTVQQTPFEKAFWEFINACEELDSFERPEKIRKVLKTSSPSERDDFTEMITIFQSPSASAPAATSNVNKDFNYAAGKCTCDTCPHREELIRIDEFYNGFLTAPESIL